MVRDAEGAEASLREALAAALEANRQLSELAERLREENAGLREQVARLLERDAERDAELEELRADLAVLQRMLFGRSSEKSRPEPPAGDGDGGGGGTGTAGPGAGTEAGPGGAGGAAGLLAPAAVRGDLGFPGGRVLLPGVRGAVHAAGGSLSGEQLDWQVIVRLVAHCRRRYRRACSAGCRRR